MLRYAITNLAEQVPGVGPRVERARRVRLLHDLHRWVTDGMDYIQLREKALHPGEQWQLASAAMAYLHQRPMGAPRPRLLLNTRADLAAASRTDGVHLTGRAGELHPGQVRAVFRAAGRSGCIVSVSCHTTGEVLAARERGSDLALFSPVFEKQVAGARVAAGTGLAALTEACRAAAPMPVLALGGIQAADVAVCLASGAAGVAGIRLFASLAQAQDSEMPATS